MRKTISLLFSITGLSIIGVIGAFIVCLSFFWIKGAQAQHKAEQFCAAIPLGAEASLVKDRIKAVHMDADFSSFDASTGASVTWMVALDRWRCDITLNAQGKVENKQAYNID